MTKKAKNITAKEIAALVGCCQQAVSAVITGRAPNSVSLEKRQQISAIARNFNYRLPPSLLGEAPIKHNKIGVIFSGHAGEIKPVILNLVTDMLYANGYDVQTALLSNPSLERQVICNLISGGVKGIISLSTRGALVHKELPIPVVSVSYDNRDIDVDWENGAKILTEHLVNIDNRKKIAFIHRTDMFSDDLIYSGISKVTKDCLELSLVECENQPEHIINLVKNNNVDAFICSYDCIAGKVMKILQQNNIRIPEDVAVTSFEGHAWTQSLTPTLTTLSYPVKGISDAIVNTILEKMKNNDLTKKETPILIMPDIFLGNSCGCKGENKVEVIWSGERPQILSK